MGLMYMFVSEQEKNYRRSDLHDRFCDVFCGFFEHNEKEFVNFLNGITCFIGYSKKRGATGIGSNNEAFKLIHQQYVDLSRLLYFIKVRQLYKELKAKNTPWDDIFLKLSPTIGDLLCSAVEEYEKKFDLPERY